MIQADSSAVGGISLCTPERDGGFRHNLSQPEWCSAVVLVWKKDGSLHFCIDFHHLNVCMKKDSYHCQESKRHSKPGWCWPFFMPGPEVQILADQGG